MQLLSASGIPRTAVGGWLRSNLRKPAVNSVREVPRLESRPFFLLSTNLFMSYIHNQFLEGAGRLYSRYNLLTKSGGSGSSATRIFIPLEKAHLSSQETPIGPA